MLLTYRSNVAALEQFLPCVCFHLPNRSVCFPVTHNFHTTLKIYIVVRHICVWVVHFKTTYCVGFFRLFFFSGGRGGVFFVFNSYQPQSWDNLWYIVLICCSWITFPINRCVVPTNRNGSNDTLNQDINTPGQFVIRFNLHWIHVWSIATHHG